MERKANRVSLQEQPLITLNQQIGKRIASIFYLHIDRIFPSSSQPEHTDGMQEISSSFCEVFPGKMALSDGKSPVDFLNKLKGSSNQLVHFILLGSVPWREIRLSFALKKGKQ